MNGIDAWIAGAALGTSVLLGVLWARAIKRVRMRRWLPWLNGLAVVALALATAGVVLATGLVPRLVAALALLPAVGFFIAQSIAPQPERRVAVQVGEPILDFRAVDGQGEAFDSSSLRGTAYLLKFYRGHW